MHKTQRPHTRGDRCGIVFYAANETLPPAAVEVIYGVCQQLERSPRPIGFGHHALIRGTESLCS